MAVRISGPPKVGIGELSRIARKKSPSAPKCRRVAAKLCVLRRLGAGASRLSKFSILPHSIKAIRNGMDFQLSANFLYDDGFKDFSVGTFDQHLVAVKADGDRCARAELAGKIPVRRRRGVLADVLHA